MILNLDERQNADRERLGACVVPGEPWTDDIGKTFVEPPQQWRDADGPCPTCAGTATIHVDQYGARYGNLIAEAMASVVHDEPCPNCVDGKPIIEIRVLCPHCGGKGTVQSVSEYTGFPDGGIDPLCPKAGCVYGSVVVARATVTLLPVHDGHKHEHDVEKDGPAVLVFSPPYVQPETGEVWVVAHYRYWGMYEQLGPFDPLPVAGRDLVAVFEEVAR